MAVSTVHCPSCKKEIPAGMLFPPNRSKVAPIGNIYVYQITTEEMKSFLVQKARFFKPETKIELVVKYTENKRVDPPKGYASLTVAFSDDVLDKKGDSGWFDRIGENEINPRFIEDIFVGFIRKYQYDGKALDDILNDYRKLEEVEKKIGLTESFIEDIKLYTTPRRISTKNNESWIFFSVRPEKIIEDMLEDPATDAVPGKVEIVSIHPINKGTVEYIVFVHPNEIKSDENPHVRQIMMGGKKKK